MVYEWNSQTAKASWCQRDSRVHLSPNSIWLVTSHHDATRHVRHVERMHFAQCRACRTARLDTLARRARLVQRVERVECRLVSRRDM